MRIHYNAPVVLNFALLCSVVLLLEQTILPGIINFFTIYGVRWEDPFWYISFFSHAIGHGDWNHLISNFTFILLIGPILEEKYGSDRLLVMILVTTFITGLMHVIFVPSTGLLGASGVVFMMILLASFTNAQVGKIPLTFILVAVLFMGKELYMAFGDDQISQFAHIIGGICGAIFGFMFGGRKNVETSNPGTTAVIQGKATKRR